MNFPTVYVNDQNRKPPSGAENYEDLSGKTFYELATEHPEKLKPIPIVPVKTVNPWAVLIIFLIVWVALDLWLKLFYVGMRKVSGTDQISTKTLFAVAAVLTVVAVVLIIWTGTGLEIIEHELDP